MTRKTLDCADEAKLVSMISMLDADPHLVIDLSSDDLVKIVGGAFQATRIASANLKTPGAAGEEENCGPGSCHPACNTWCHDWVPAAGGKTTR